MLKKKALGMVCSKGYICCSYPLTADDQGQNNKTELLKKAIHGKCPLGHFTVFGENCQAYS